MSNKQLKQLMEEARQIIKDLGLTSKMLGDTPVYVFLTLLGMSTEISWQEATNQIWKITPIIEKIKELGWASFKPNTRETIRDECVGILVDASLVTPNTDEPLRSKNSKHYCYQINPEVLELVKLYGTEEYNNSLEIFLSQYQTLKQRYTAQRKARRIPLRLPNGQENSLSPGGQNNLIANIIEDFAPQFQLDRLLYLGEAEKRYLIFDKQFLTSLKVNVDELEKSPQIPDVILYKTNKNILVIVEAVKTGGEINVARRDNLMELFESCTAKICFVNAFENFQVFKKFLKTITWETHAWLADNPTHMIHFNGIGFGLMKVSEFSVGSLILSR